MGLGDLLLVNRMGLGALALARSGKRTGLGDLCFFGSGSGEGDLRTVRFGLGVLSCGLTFASVTDDMNFGDGLAAFGAREEVTGLDARRLTSEGNTEFVF